MANAARAPRKEKNPDIVRLGIIRDHSKHPDGANHEMTKALKRFANINFPLNRPDIQMALQTGYFKHVFSHENFGFGLFMLQTANPRAAYHLGIFIAEQMLPHCQHRTVRRTLEVDPRCAELVEWCKSYLETGKWHDQTTVANYYCNLVSGFNGSPQAYNRFAVEAVTELAHGVSDISSWGISNYQLRWALENAIEALPDKAAIDVFIKKVYDKFLSILEAIQDGKKL